ncbi:MAG: aspartate dehydrogenase [Rhodospirillales bacterium]|nr:MAG: aspartate dehydrogenase [Rhodospirillales bacterium]
MRVAVAGLGAIGWKVATALDAGIDGLALAAVAGRDAAKTAAQAARLATRPEVVASAADLPARADIVVDCAPSAAFAALARATVDAGRILMSVNAGALLRNLDLVERAKATGGRIIVPTGALLGLDAVRAAAEGRIDRVTMITRKPPDGLEGAPYLVERGISLVGLKQATRVFTGTASEGARGFPANVNVAAALGLAGIGPDRTSLEIWADPAVDRNIHVIEVEADSARLTLRIENVPSAENPKTGRITALSVIACLRGMTSPLRVGT